MIATKEIAIGSIDIIINLVNGIEMIAGRVVALSPGIKKRVIHLGDGKKLRFSGTKYLI